MNEELENPYTSPKEVGESENKNRVPWDIRKKVLLAAFGNLLAGGIPLFFNLQLFISDIILEIRYLSSINFEISNLNDVEMASLKVMVFTIFATAFFIVLQLIILYGVIHMVRMKSFTWASVSCYLAMIPCVGCNLIGTIIGGCAAFIINGKEIKQAFASEQRKLQIENEKKKGSEV
ncbi:Hypothetical protein PBC10988_18520 [Planctomycetales bacterium 10988]|nr:Hypothetical protein PBC10988_18520 [Planctomycetales bacterium 10988]